MVPGNVVRKPVSFAIRLSLLVESSGEPRYHIAQMELRRDISNALTTLAPQPEVDASHIGGWGISIGGGHMLFLDTWEPRLKAVVATSTCIDSFKESLSP